MEFLIRNKCLEAEDKELCEFGMEQGIWMVLNVLTAVILGWITAELPLCVIYMALYIPLRRYTGGYHADTYFRCWLYSSVLVLAVLLGIRYWKVPMLVCHTITLVCACMILVSGPVAVKNRPLDQQERADYGRKSAGITILWMVLSAASGIAGWVQVQKCVMFVLLTMVSLMLVEKYWGKGNVKE